MTHTDRLATYALKTRTHNGGKKKNALTKEKKKRENNPQSNISIGRDTFWISGLVLFL